MQSEDQRPPESDRSVGVPERIRRDRHPLRVLLTIPRRSRIVAVVHNTPEHIQISAAWLATHLNLGITEVAAPRELARWRRS